MYCVTAARCRHQARTYLQPGLQEQQLDLRRRWGWLVQLNLRATSSSSPARGFPVLCGLSPALVAVLAGVGLQQLAVGPNGLRLAVVGRRPGLPLGLVAIPISDRSSLQRLRQVGGGIPAESATRSLHRVRQQQGRTCFESCLSRSCSTCMSISHCRMSRLRFSRRDSHSRMARPMSRLAFRLRIRVNAPLSFSRLRRVCGLRTWEQQQTAAGVSGTANKEGWAGRHHSPVDFLAGPEHVVVVLVRHRGRDLQPAEDGLVQALPLFQPVLVHRCEGAGWVRFKSVGVRKPLQQETHPQQRAPAS